MQCSWRRPPPLPIAAITREGINMQSGIRNVARGAPVVAVLTMLTACGGGDSVSVPPPGYTVGGTVTGLSGSGLVLQDTYGADLAITASGAFTFPTPLVSGASYSITVKSWPASPPQACQVTNGAGTINAANVTNVSVTCQSGFTVSGTVSGLVGSGLTLATCMYGRHGPGGGGPAICINQRRVGANGTFTFNVVLPSSYSGFVSITQQPSSPTQRCAISNAGISIQTVSGAGFTVACTGYAYVTNGADNTLSAYSIDPTTGALALLGTPIATGTSPSAAAAAGAQYDDPNVSGYVYVANKGSNDISAFTVNNTTGELTVVPGAPFAAGTDPQGILLGPADYLYVANAGSDNVFLYPIPYGALQAPSTIATGKNPTSMAIAPLYSAVVYVANHGGSNDISAFLYDGTPVRGSPFPAGGNPLSLAVGAGGRFLYSANPDAKNPSISGFNIDQTGALTPLPGSPLPLPVSHYIATDQTGAYLYVTSGASIVGYAIDSNTGALTALSGFPVAAGTNAYSITIDPSNQFLYVANDGAASISGFRRDATTGALTPMVGSPFPAGNHPQFIATF